MGYYTRRIAQAVITLIAGTFITYALYRMMPGSPLDSIMADLIQQRIGQGRPPDPSEIAAQAERMTGINPDSGIIEGFLGYTSDIVLNQNFGESIYYNQPVFDILFRAMPWSVFISVYGLLLGYTATIVIGAVMAWYEGTKIDSGLVAYVLAMNSIPYYVVAVVMLVFLGYQWELLPKGGKYPPTAEPGFNVEFMIGLVRYGAMPILSSFVVGFASGSLNMRGNAVRVMGSDFIRSAKIRGISVNRILTRYLTRNAILPIYTGMMMGIARLFSSNVITERIFQYIGLGYYTFEALERQDYPLMMGAFLFFTFITILGILFADLTYGLIDPRAGTGSTRESF
ncbi:ABC-type dipeptide/oligopeptide/nickel transportsystem, permease component [Halorhabdus sp. SVX81]|uniref:ABC transporter permease n=1 Tax=Halorhabdus sp. SVX81 TaxID=2978283 RepID=UPI0023DC3F45|nr:ABC transporter permease [Halorhabdus sp. SVX81]WEL18585.1 ABC-type dipeptide/oligopeptide/nickel transportsystem, permease component [Halorhabdus sp. SVX81]